jgi:hypothetical protein
VSDAPNCDRSDDLYLPKGRLKILMALNPDLKLWRLSRVNLNPTGFPFAPESNRDAAHPVGASLKGAIVNSKY